MIRNSAIVMAAGNSKDIIKKFSMSPEYVSQIKRTLINRPTEPFSSTMSEEARMAMKMAAEDSKSHKKSRRHDKKSDDPCNKSKDRNNGQAKSWGCSSKNNGEIKKVNFKKQSSYTEIFQKNGTIRLEGDITDANYSEAKLKKRAVGGGRIESAMETIVILNADDPPDIDDIAIEETAKLNSVEKCLVWMELHDDEDMSVKPDEHLTARPEELSGNVSPIKS